MREHGLRVRMEREGRQDAQVIDSPIHFQRILAGPQRPPPELAEHTDEVLSEFGYSEEEIGRLRDEGVVD